MICGAAVYAAQQVKLAFEQLKVASDQLKTTKEIATATARRESVKLASEHCRYYAERVVPAFQAAVNKYRESQCTFLDPVAIPQGAPQGPAFIINSGDFGTVTYNLQRITAQQWNAVNSEFVTVLNTLESFAIPFAAGVADDATGFQETAPAFIANLNYLSSPRNLIFARDSGIAVRQYFEALQHLEQPGCRECSRTSFAGDAEDGR